MSTTPKLPDRVFTLENAVANNGVFLLCAKDEPPFMGAVHGWKIVGWGAPPWPKADSNVAIMLEKITPAESYGGHKGEDMPEGTRLWHHGISEWLPDHPRYYREK